jgi:hypothetical protein
MPSIHVRPQLYGGYGLMGLGQDDSGMSMQPSPVDWMQQQLIAGIPNWVLVGGFLLWSFTRHPRGGGGSKRDRD